MKELHEEENGMISHTLKSGDLKMVKVRRGKRGHRQSRSLVFRISRSSRPISDDSGIKCSSTEEEASSGEQTQTSPLKIRIPKSVLLCGSEKKETNGVESVSLENSTLQSNDLFNQHKNDFSGKMEVSGTSVDDKNQHADIMNTNTSTLCDNSVILNSELKQAEAQMNETKSCDLRRSSRRILLRVQKDCQSDLSVKESMDCHNFPFVSSNSSGQQVHMEEKRKRGRKPGFRAPECKKRKYGRRGRPPKSPFPKHLNLVKSVTSGGGRRDKLVLVPPTKNSVWTLVPKELFESDFFKSQLLKVRVTDPAENGIKTTFAVSTPGSFSSTGISQIPTQQTNGLKHLKIPIISVNNVPATREKMPEERDPKRPTVIYFKTEKKKLDYPEDQKRELRNPQLLTQNEVSKTQNDLIYLFNKYRMMEDIMLKNYYELAGGNLNEAESMLSNFISNSPAVYAEEKAPRICESQVNSSNCADFDLISSDQPSRPVVDRLIPCSQPTLEDVDTLSRKIIVQSLLILFSEEATLT